MRLQKILAEAGVASRRKAEEMIAAGRVTVDGVTVTEMGYHTDPGRTIAVDGVPIRREPRRTYVFYKPQGVISAVTDPRGRPTVSDYFREVPLRLYPVGRLDYDTEGLLLMTNDGALAQKVTHPSHAMEKAYRVVVRGLPSEEDMTRLRNGIPLEEGMTAPAELRVIHRGRETVTLLLTIREGRNRQVRRMFAALGYTVQNLRRVREGNITLEGLQPGEYRLLSDEEVSELSD
ncbi:MAG: pseudouridine synthase [Christensenellales bacterium]|jgi:23S rRNA pseudouridine2605 synthase